MGQVPRLQTTSFDSPLDTNRSQHWVFAAVGLAALAALVALYAALRPASTPDSPILTTAGSEQEAVAGANPGDEAGLVSDAGAGAGPGAVLGSGFGAERVELAASAQGTTADAGASNSSSQAPMRLDDPDDLSVEPQVLVVPAPPKPGERLPRGADELRRAVLGPDISPSIEPSSKQRAPSPRPQPPAIAAPERDYTPVPPELIAEIEEFKRTYQSGSGSASGSDEDSVRRTSAAPARAKAVDRDAQDVRQAASRERPAPLSSTLRRQLPPFLMTVHVYDDDPARRFVYLNGSKVREGESTRDGFLIEQVLADGAIVRYDEHRFFQSP